MNRPIGIFLVGLFLLLHKRITELEYNAIKGIPQDEQITAFEVLAKIRENITNEKEK